jgi:hypothetical protein
MISRAEISCRSPGGKSSLISLIYPIIGYSDLESFPEITALLKVGVYDEVLQMGTVFHILDPGDVQIYLESTLQDYSRINPPAWLQYVFHPSLFS